MSFKYLQLLRRLCHRSTSPTIESSLRTTSLLLGIKRCQMRPVCIVHRETDPLHLVGGSLSSLLRSSYRAAGKKRQLRRRKPHKERFALSELRHEVGKTTILKHDRQGSGISRAPPVLPSTKSLVLIGTRLISPSCSFQASPLLFDLRRQVGGLGSLPGQRGGAISEGALDQFQDVPKLFEAFLSVLVLLTPALHSTLEFLD